MTNEQIVDAMDVSRLELHYACVYLNNDRVFHGSRWRVDAGKLQAALSFGKAEAARIVARQQKAAEASR